MLKNFLLLTLKSFSHRQVRSWLTIVGVVIGISLVVIILALSSGIQNAVARQMQMFGSELVIVFPGKETNPFAGLLGGQKFKEEDIEALRDIEGVKAVLPADIAVLNTEFKGEEKSIVTHGAPWGDLQDIFEEAQGIGIYEGRWPDSEVANEVVFGYIPANTLFRNTVRIGDELVIKSKRMRIVGFISSIGNSLDDNTIYVSREIFGDLTGIRGKTSSATLTIYEDANPELIAKQIRFELNKQDEVREFSIITPKKAGRLIGGVLTIIELGLVMIALISLIVGAVGIMNTMYTSVLERTKQIGVMKAIGASSEDILTLFLLESGMIGLAGGILGIFFGLTIAYLIAVAASYGGVPGLFSFAALDFYGLAVVLIITFIVGILSGVLPARTASKLEPAEALRYE